MQQILITVDIGSDEIIFPSIKTMATFLRTAIITKWPFIAFRTALGLSCTSFRS